MAEEKKYGIGEVQELLKKEFPDITISKIRFLEKEGLINPERTPSGYRKYSKDNIKQLSYILRLQREEYLPLSVIKRKIQDLKSGKVVAGDLTVMSGQGSEPALTGAVPVSLDMAPAKLGLSSETLKELVDYGIVKVHDGPEGKYFPPSEMKILNLTKEFFRYGVEPRHLRMYTQFVGREASFIEQIIRPQLEHKDPNTKRSAIKDLENLMALSQMFIQALLRESLSKYLPRPAGFDLMDEEQIEGAEEAEEDMEAAAEAGETSPDEDVSPGPAADGGPPADRPPATHTSPQMFPE
ncbi:MAG TPA: MerR family transcriptional regulator [Candidatus Anoxymicrobiaceae bacterium]